jgi:hypothetical protein
VERLRDKIKKAHERAVGDELLDSLGIKPASVAHGDPDKNEPDRLYKIDEKTVGIEVVTAYYTEVEARIAHEAAEKPLAANEATVGEIIGGPDDAICKSIQVNLNQKSAKKYSGTDETWLCINVDAAVTEMATIKECVAGLEVPENHPFTKIFVTVRNPEADGSGLQVIEVPV